MQPVQVATMAEQEATRAATGKKRLGTAGTVTTCEYPLLVCAQPIPIADIRTALKLENSGTEPALQLKGRQTIVNMPAIRTGPRCLWDLLPESMSEVPGLGKPCWDITCE